MSENLDAAPPAPESRPIPVLASESSEVRPELIPLPDSPPPSSAVPTPDIPPPDSTTAQSPTAETDVVEVLGVQDEDQGPATGDAATTNSLGFMTAATEETTRNEQAGEEPTVTSPVVEILEKPVERTFTTPNGQPMTVIEQLAKPPNEVIESTRPGNADEHITIVEQPVETVKEAMITEKEPSKDQLVYIIDEPLQIVKDANLVKIQPADSEVFFVTQNPTEKSEEVITSDEHTPKTEQTAESATDIVATGEPAVGKATTNEEPAGEKVTATEDPVNEIAAPIEDPAVQSIAAAEEPAVEAVTAVEEPVVESVAPVKEPAVDEQAAEELAAEEPTAEAITTIKGPTTEPVTPIEKPEIAPTTAVEEPAVQDSAVEPVSAIAEQVVEPATATKEPAVESVTTSEEPAADPAIAMDDPAVEPDIATEGPTIEEPAAEHVVDVGEQTVEPDVATDDKQSEHVEISDRPFDIGAVADQSSAVAEQPAEPTQEIILVEDPPAHEQADDSEDVLLLPVNIPIEKVSDEVALTNNVPVENVPVQRVVVDEAPVTESVLEEVPVHEVMVEEVPIQETVVEDVPIQEVVVEEVPVQEVVVEEIPGLELVAEEVPVQEVMVEDLPIQEVGVEEVPVQELVVEDVSVKEILVHEIPAQDTPVQEVREVLVEDSLVQKLLSPEMPVEGASAPKALVPEALVPETFITEETPVKDTSTTPTAKTEPEIDKNMNTSALDEDKRDNETVEEVQPPEDRESSLGSSTLPVETLAADDTSVLSPDVGAPALQPKAASICAMPTTPRSTNIIKRWKSHYDIKTFAPSLQPLEPPAAAFSPYIAQTETRLRLHRHFFPYADGETHRITDESAQPLFHVITASPSQFWDQAIKTLIHTQSRTPILQVRPRRSPFVRLVGAQWQIEALADFPQRPPRAILKRRSRYWPFCGHRPALTGSFIRHDDGAMQEFNSRDNLSGLNGGVLRLGAVEDGPAVAVMQMVVNQKGDLPPAAPVRDKTFEIRVGKGFDRALTCAILVALDERRWWWADPRRKAFQESVEVVTTRDECE